MKAIITFFALILSFSSFSQRKLSDFKKDKLDGQTFKLPYHEFQKKYLWLIYYKQMDYFREKNRFAGSIRELGMTRYYQIEGKRNYVDIISRPNGFLATIESENGSEWSIDEVGLIQQVKSTP